MKKDIKQHAAYGESRGRIMKKYIDGERLIELYRNQLIEFKRLIKNGCHPDILEPQYHTLRGIRLSVMMCQMIPFEELDREYEETYKEFMKCLEKY